ncbi:acyl-CoA thioesterase [Bavariicoccus seileri]|uniref:acyl-CoA thioesterase n=1 Tax=Bavariicoccus seileri TaxID=549685 RepID=UPI003F9301DD
MKCVETKVVQSHMIKPKYLNNHQTLFGGYLLAWLDECGGLTARRFGKDEAMTASIDNLNFLEPIMVTHQFTVMTYVSGVGTKSIEVFAKMIGEDLDTRKKYLAASTFLTFVFKDQTFTDVTIEPVTEEEIYICQGYQARVAQRKMNRQLQAEFVKVIDTKYL